MAQLSIRRATPADADGIWAALEPIVRAGETLAMPRDWSREQALARWMASEREIFVAEDDGVILGSYYLQPNQPGGGAHVANAGYIVSPAARGRGLARAMCEHSLAHAKARGYAAIQFNFVVSTNAPAVHLWTGLGFETVGRLPGAFRHPRLGDVDALVMFRRL